MEILLIRADADAVIGTGHIMRCLALAHAWQEKGGQVVFATTCQSLVLLEKIRVAGIEVVQFDARHPAAEDLAITLDTVRKYQARWLVVDGYHFDSDYQRNLLALESRGCRLLVVDDYGHWPEYNAHLVLNQNLIFPQPEVLEKYRLADQAVILSGPGYALLRKGFKEAAAGERVHPELARNILVTLGGADPDNQSGKILAALDQIVMPLAVKVIVGAANPWREDLSEMVAANRHRVEILQDVSDMETHMLWADLAISAGGSTCWELCCLGTPNLILTIAENQWIIANGLSRCGASLSLGWYADTNAGQISRQVEKLIVDPGLRRRMSTRGKELVWGDGAARVVAVLQEWSGKRMALGVTVRLAVRNDCEWMYQWRNNAATRRYFFDSTEIEHQKHCDWFEKVLVAEDIVLLVVEEQGYPIGVVRFNLQEEGQVAEVSLYVDPARQGAGLGKKIMAAGEGYLCRNFPGVRAITAQVMQENIASRKLFLQADFMETESNVYRKWLGIKGGAVS